MSDPSDDSLSFDDAGSGHEEPPQSWWHGITGYQWLVLVVASAGWMFDVYESQVFNITREDMLAELISPTQASSPPRDRTSTNESPSTQTPSTQAPSTHPPSSTPAVTPTITPADEAARAAATRSERDAVRSEGDAVRSEVKRWGDYFLAIFLAGGTLGGLVFGSLADRYGRQPILIATILMYSIFSGLNFFVTEMWQAAWLRFFVAIGIGGEWAVAAAMVAEVFPRRARAQASAIFHASSIFGTWLAAVVGILVASQWRWAYVVGVLPALLIVVVRLYIKEPDAWRATHATDATAPARGSFRELLFDPRWRRRAILGLGLAAIGLGTFWSVVVAGQNLAERRLLADGVASLEAKQTAKFAYGIVQAAGGGLGLLAFGPLCAWLGRRRTFLLFQFAAVLIVPIVCFVPQSYGQLLALLPLFGFLTLAIHSGFAIYFPELFPTHLRATGTSFCFNGGRIAAVPILLLSGNLKANPDLPLPAVITALSLLFLLGMVLVLLLPETKDQPLPD